MNPARAVEMMDQTTYCLNGEILLDARRALFFESKGILAVADLHLGYAWAHRHSGQMMPVNAGEDCLPRLLELQRAYSPSRIVLLGDIVHRALDLPALRSTLGEMIGTVGAGSELVLAGGNHDTRLECLLERDYQGVTLRREFRTEGCLFTHGDGEPLPANCGEEVTIIGHEHPAISLDDGVATSAKCPCFLLARNLIVLPAFSNWAAGSSFGHYPFMSPLSRAAVFEKAVAIVGNRLLPVKL